MEDLVKIIGKEVVCSSVDVAEKFRKRHDNVLRDIDNIVSLLTFEEQNYFKKSSRVARDGQSHRIYIMNKDGFSLLVMGFKGKKAMDWKIKYIKAFNKAIKTLEQLQSQERLEAREQGKIARRAETDAIKLFVEYAKSQGSTHASRYYMIFSKLANETCNVTDRNLATPEQLINLAVCENIIRNSVMAGMVEGKYYKDIYQDARARLADFAAIAYIGQTFQLVKGA